MDGGTDDAPVWPSADESTDGAPDAADRDGQPRRTAAPGTDQPTGGWRTAAIVVGVLGGLGIAAALLLVDTGEVVSDGTQIDIQGEAAADEPDEAPDLTDDRPDDDTGAAYRGAAAALDNAAAYYAAVHDITTPAEVKDLLLDLAAWRTGEQASFAPSAEEFAAVHDWTTRIVVKDGYIGPTMAPFLLDDATDCADGDTEECARLDASAAGFIAEAAGLEAPAGADPRYAAWPDVELATGTTDQVVEAFERTSTLLGLQPDEQQSQRLRAFLEDPADTDVRGEFLAAGAATSLADELDAAVTGSASRAVASFDLLLAEAIDAEADCARDGVDCPAAGLLRQVYVSRVQDVPGG